MFDFSAWIYFFLLELMWTAEIRTLTFQLSTGVLFGVILTL